MSTPRHGRNVFASLGLVLGSDAAAGWNSEMFGALFSFADSKGLDDPRRKWLRLHCCYVDI